MSIKTAALIAILLIACGWIWLLNFPVPMISIIFNVLGLGASLRARQLYEEGEDLF